jgi:ribosome maturation factor RimP
LKPAFFVQDALTSCEQPRKQGFQDAALNMTGPAQRIIEKVSGLVNPILEEGDYELVDVVFLTEHGRWVLRLYVDKEGGVTLDDCVALSREIGDLLDVEDMIEQEYVLEVSSPGLDRPLTREKDFIRFTGEKIKVKLSEPMKGRRKFVGLLKQVEGGAIHLDVDGAPVEIPLDAVQKANLVYEF